MHLTHISCTHFRNFSKREFDFAKPFTFITGENARGKTNLLEAIHFITMGEGFRDSKEEELIEIGYEEGSVRAEFEVGGKTLSFHIFLKKSSEGSVEKTYAVNKAKKKHSQYLTLSTRSVLFSPDQMLIMSGAPDYRRRYLDRVIVGFDQEYRKRLINYESALRRRNKILEHHVSIASLKEELSFWDVYLTEQAAYITQARENYIDFLNRYPSIEKREFAVSYIKNRLTLDILEKEFERERRYRRTLVGPQKDDFVVSQKKGTFINLHHFGSRSEQRLAVYWLKLMEARAYEEKQKVRPLLLLDDIFSELDAHNKQLTVETIHHYQTVMTTAEPETVGLAKKSKNVIRL